MKDMPSSFMLREALSYLERVSGHSSIATLAYPNKSITAEQVESMGFQECADFLEMCKATKLMAHMD